MKLAIATEGNMVSNHFGRCENFTLCEIEGNRLIEKSLINTQGNQHASLPNFLTGLKVNVVISGGAGSGAMQSLNQKGIKIITGVQGPIDSVIDAYLKGQLESSEVICNEHQHQHQHGHSCNCSCH